MMAAIAATSIRASSARRLWLAAVAACWCAAAVAEGPAHPSPLDAKVARLEAKHAANPSDLAATEQLAEALLVRLRVNADPRDASRAEALVERALERAPNDARAWTLKAWTEVSAHGFSAALASAHHARRLGAANAMNLGVLADALVELGRYAEAVKVTQELVDRFPGLPAYSRAAHLRFLHGDLAGAIALMRRSIQAGQPRTEETAWALGQLAELHLQDGRLELAEQAAEAASKTFRTLPQTLAQLGRVREAQGRFEDALALYREAADAQPSAEFVYPRWRLAQRLGFDAEARQQAELLRGLAKLDERSGLSRRPLAEFFAMQPDGLAEAERLARLELENRPDIYSQDLLAWVLYRSGRLAPARTHAEAALKLGTPDVGLMYRAGTILSAAKQAKRGGELLRQARTRAPYLDPRSPINVSARAPGE
jgi:tetratricopeptide (TPR) repeat protein